MMVLDASVVLELLLRTPEASRLEAIVLGGGSLHAPELLDVECAQVLRRYVRRREMTPAAGAGAVRLLDGFPMVRHRHRPLLPRIWALRAHLTAYDAAYVALAEALDAPLLTRDGRLARAPGHTARIRLL